MANTVIQIKRSSVTATPVNGSLSAAELAYSYNSDKLFIGTANGSNVNEIGGTYWVNTTIAAFDKANAAALTGMNYPYVNAATVSANSWANSIGAASNNWANTIAQNWANTRLANVIATAGRTTVAWSTTNGYTNATIDLATTAVSAATYGGADQIPSFTVDSYGRLTFAGNNSYLPTVYAHANNVGVSANAYAVTVGAASNNYANATFYSKSGGTISGDVTVTGNVNIAKDLNVTGNVTFTNTTSLVVSDPLLYLAGNNYTSDIVDIGFIANYNNGSANLHTGLYREHANKQYYLFDSYDKEPENNHIDPSANGFQLAALNAELITSNLNLGGANAITWINSLYPYANGVANSSNAYSITIGASSNAWTNSLSTVDRAISNAAANSANAYTVTVGAASNTWANSLSTVDRAISNAAANSANAYTVTVGAASNTWANTTAQNWANTRLANVIAGTGTTISFSNTNGYTNATITLAVSGVSAATYGGSGTIPFFTVDTYGRVTLAGNSGINVSAASTGTLPVARGGTGNTTFIANSVLIGNGTNPVWGLSSSTEGHVLQVSAAGAPQFSMLDGGSF